MEFRSCYGFACRATKSKRASELLLTGPVLLDGAPGRIRTSDPQVRSLVLYPAELRAQNRSGIMPVVPAPRQRNEELELAETEGFEPSMELLTPYSLSRGAPSASRASLRGH